MWVSISVMDNKFCSGDMLNFYDIFVFFLKYLCNFDDFVNRVFKNKINLCKILIC